MGTAEWEEAASSTDQGFAGSGAKPPLANLCKPLITYKVSISLFPFYVLLLFSFPLSYPPLTSFSNYFICLAIHPSTHPPPYPLISTHIHLLISSVQSTTHRFVFVFWSRHLCIHLFLRFIVLPGFLGGRCVNSEDQKQLLDRREPSGFPSIFSCSSSSR